MRKMLLASAMLATLATPSFAAGGSVMHVIYTIGGSYTKDTTQQMDSADACKAGVANYLASSFVASLRATGNTVVAGCE